MLAQLSIRAKLVAVVSLLLVSPAAIGVFGLLQVTALSLLLARDSEFTRVARAPE